MSNATKKYIVTTSALARETGLTQPTIRTYCRLGLLDFIVASDGTRLLAKGQANKVRSINERRLAQRGVRQSVTA